MTTELADFPTAIAELRQIRVLAFETGHLETLTVSIVALAQNVFGLLITGL